MYKSNKYSENYLYCSQERKSVTKSEVPFRGYNV